MFSVIIPTLWKTDMIFKSLNDLEKCPLITEIILINNLPGHKPDLTRYKKINLISPSENLYINPSWNLGIEVAKNELICLLNDDINFDANLIFNFVLQTSKLLGAFGFNPDSNSEIPCLTLGQNIGKDWGCMLFLKKSTYIPIPPQLKLWYGDDWIYKTYFPSSYTIHCNIDAKSSVTLSSPKLQPIIEQDKNEWLKLRL